MGTSYKQLGLKEREEISLFRSQGKTARQIGKLLGRHHTTIAREMKRNTSSNQRLYLPHHANEKATRRKQISAQRDRLKDSRIREYVESHLKIGWSPEQIAGRLPLDGSQATISHEAIYQYVYEECPHLIQCLPRRYKKRHGRGWIRKSRKCHIPNRVSIKHRPVNVNKRQEIGHWEADLAISAINKVSIGVLCERRSRYVKITKLKDKTARFSRQAICDRLKDYPPRLRKTITYDNGPENTDHQFVNRILGTQSYFCRPQHSWEKGTVENTIGLIRRFLPKKTDFAKIRENDIQTIENHLNSRPRKCLGFLTPDEVFNHLGGALPR